MNAPARPCSACHGPHPGVITETFTDTARAFARHAQLVRSGQAPSFCMRRDGTRHVCHLAPAPLVPPCEADAAATESPLLPAAACVIAAHA